MKLLIHLLTFTLTLTIFSPIDLGVKNAILGVLAHIILGFRGKKIPKEALLINALLLSIFSFCGGVYMIYLYNHLWIPTLMILTLNFTIVWNLKSKAQCQENKEKHVA